MKRILLTGLFLLSFVSFSACTSNDSVENFTVGGVPGWLAGGAKLDDEPAPYKPDPAIIEHEDDSDPLSFELITDNRHYAAPPVKKATARAADPIERGRDSRIKRLFR